MRISTSQFQQLSSSSILEQQARLLKTQQQLATGRRIVTPADDPAGATRVLNLDKAVATVEQYNRNIGQAQVRLEVEESVLEQVGNLVQRARDLSVQANNASQGPEERRFIASEIRQVHEQLVQLANAQDGKGEYLFSGSKSRMQPFVRDGGGIIYQGDQQVREVQVGPERTLASSHHGLDVFMRLPGGNGDFRVQVDEGNQGTARLVDDRAASAGIAFNGPYTLSFQVVGEETEYTVTDDDGAVVATGAYVPGEPITFDGRVVAFEGTPADGDSFTMERDGNQSLFGTLQQMITTLESDSGSAASRARINTELYGVIQGLDNAQNGLLDNRAQVGARLNTLQREAEANGSILLDLKSARSRVEDLDYAEAISRFNLQQVGLQAAQQSYIKIQGLSLFNFL